MKSIYIAIYLVLFSLLASCIDDYDVTMGDEDNEILVVEGQIIGGTDCEFILQRSSSRHHDYIQDKPDLLLSASVYVICSNGQVFGAVLQEDCHYHVNLGELDPSETYHLLIKLDHRSVYESEPMYPLPTPELKEVSYTMGDDGIVQLRITNADPQSEMYYLWNYDEHWEINTPFMTEWRFDPRLDAIVPLEEDIHRGWCSDNKHQDVIGNNRNFGNGALQDYALYTLSNKDKRFNTRYHTKVRQFAISKAEYEYYKQKEAQTTQTGGIFTLMPAQLPSNIHNDHGYKAEGFIGVHLNYSEAELYINSREVGYKSERQPEIIPEEEVSKITRLSYLYNKGYRVYHYNQFLNKSEWTKPWCIDCRDGYWGASLERPDFWQDE